MSISINGSIRNLLFSFLCIYFAQGFFYPNGSVISKISLLFVLGVSFVFFIKEIVVINKNLFVSFLLAFILMNIIGFIIGMEYGGIYYSQLRNIMTAILPFFAVYSLTKASFIKEKHLRILFVAMLIISILNFYHSQSVLMFEQDRENVLSNAGYMFVALLPLVFLFDKKKLMQMVFLMLMMFMTIKSAKRGAIITFGLGALVILFYQLKNSPSDKRLASYALSFLMIIVVMFFAIDQLHNNEFLLKRMENISDGSGRSRIYSNLFNAWVDSDSLLNYIFGFGFVATISKSGSGHLAHNDWLELLTNFGLLGVFLYLFTLGYLLIYFFIKSNDDKSRYGMLLIFVLWFFQTGFSMFYTSSSSVFSLMLIAYYLGLRERPLGVQAVE